MKSNNVIEINGRLYDAKSGEPLESRSEVTPVKPLPTIKKIAVSSTSQKSIDGFSRRSATTTQGVKAAPKTPVHAPAQIQKEQPNRSTSPKMKRVIRRSTTLHRNSVKAPKPSEQNQVAQKVVAAAPSSANLSSSALKHADTERFKRAQTINKSGVISRFHTPAAHNEQTTQATKESKPLTSHLAKTHHEEAPAQVSSLKEDLIKNAIANAPSHTAPTKKTRSKKHQLGRYATSGLVALLLAGYVAYLNVPSISMKVAAHRAGFAAAMPGYKPSGYSLKGPIAYSPGQVTVNFKSNTDSREFSLKQQPTTWDSTALLENLVTKKSPNYLTYQDRGLTIYIYNGSSASWVNGGKLYNVEGNNSQLDTDQLLKIATSV